MMRKSTADSGVVRKPSRMQLARPSSTQTVETTDSTKSRRRKNSAVISVSRMISVSHRKENGAFQRKRKLLSSE